MLRHKGVEIEQPPQLVEPGARLWAPIELAYIDNQHVLVSWAEQPPGEVCTWNLEGIEPTLAATLAFLLSFQLDGRHAALANYFYDWVRAIPIEHQLEAFSACPPYGYSPPELNSVFEKSEHRNYGINSDLFADQVANARNMFGYTGFLSKILGLPISRQLKNSTKLIPVVRFLIDGDAPLEAAVTLSAKYSEWRRELFKLAISQYKPAAAWPQDQEEQIEVIKKVIERFSPQVDDIALDIRDYLKLPEGFQIRIAQILTGELTAGLTFVSRMQLPHRAETTEDDFFLLLSTRHEAVASISLLISSMPVLGPVPVVVSASEAPVCPVRQHTRIAG